MSSSISNCPGRQRNSKSRRSVVSRIAAGRARSTHRSCPSGCRPRWRVFSARSARYWRRLASLGCWPMLRANEGDRHSYGTRRYPRSREPNGGDERGWLVSVGPLLGAPAAFWFTRFAARSVENLPAGGTMPIAFAAVALIAVAFIAVYVPARRGTRVDPVIALRAE